METTTNPNHTVTIYGVEEQVKVGSYIFPEGWAVGERLISSDWDQAEFRLPSHAGSDIQLAVNIKITGRTLQRRPYSDRFWVKVQIEFVGDGEPSRFHPGWLLVEGI